MKEIIQIHFLTVMLMISSLMASAQTTIKNPFGLVYGGAITENVPGKVNMHPVTL